MYELYPIYKELTADYNILTGFSLDLIKIQHDGPSLRLSAGFSVLSSGTHSVSNKTDAIENQCKQHESVVNVF